MSQVTKRALEESLKKILLDKPLNRVTVSDITNDCGISRMTFYYHFKDIYELIEWSCLEDAKNALGEKKTYDTWEEGFLQIFDTVNRNRNFVLNVFRSVGREPVENYLFRATYLLIRSVVEEQSEGYCVREEDRDFIANLYKYSFVGLMLDWIKGGMKEDPVLIVEKLSLAIHGNIIHALEAFSV